MAFVCFGAEAETADAFLDRAAAKARAAKGIDCNFTLSTGGKSVKGSLKTAGGKFTVSTPVGVSWYNGKTLATYNPSTRETTMVYPSAEELEETNPMAYLTSYKKNYTAAYSKASVKGKKVIVLQAKKRHAAIRSVTLTINSATLAPEKFVIKSSDNSATTVTVTSINYASSFQASTFEYPRKSYPSAEIIDLR